MMPLKTGFQGGKPGLLRMDPRGEHAAMKKPESQDSGFFKLR